MRCCASFFDFAHLVEVPLPHAGLVAVEDQMDPLEAPQRFDCGGPDVRAEERQGGLRPLLEGQPVEDTFDDRTRPACTTPIPSPEVVWDLAVPDIRQIAVV